MGENKKKEPKPRTIQYYAMDNRQQATNFHCPICKGVTTPHKEGARTITGLGSRAGRIVCIYQEYKAYCPKCNTSFDCLHPNFPKKYHYATEVIAEVYYLRFQGKMALEFIVDHLWESWSIELTKQTINTWLYDRELAKIVEQWKKNPQTIQRHGDQLESQNELGERKKKSKIPLIFVGDDISL